MTTLDETRHGLEDGDYVTFTEIKGMEKLNDGEPRKIIVKGPYTFSIGDVSGLGNYEEGGLFAQVKMPKLLDFVSLFCLLTWLGSDQRAIPFSCRKAFENRLKPPTC